MAITLVQKSTAVTTVASGAGSVVTPTLPGGTAAGNLLIGWVHLPTSASTRQDCSSPAGWLLAADLGLTAFVFHDSYLNIWYYPNCAAGITSVAFTLSTTNSGGDAYLAEFAGADTSSPLDKTGTAQAGTSATSVAAATSAA